MWFSVVASRPLAPDDDGDLPLRLAWAPPLLALPWGLGGLILLSTGTSGSLSVFIGLLGLAAVSLWIHRLGQTRMARFLAQHRERLVLPVASRRSG